LVSEPVDTEEFGGVDKMSGLRGKDNKRHSARDEFGRIRKEAKQAWIKAANKAYYRP
jgi:hypothetical protein